MKTRAGPTCPARGHGPFHRLRCPGGISVGPGINKSTVRQQAVDNVIEGNEQLLTCYTYGQGYLPSR